MESTIENNKSVVRRFNKEVIEQGNTDTFYELMHENFINHSAPAGSDNGPQGMLHTFNAILRIAIPDLKVNIDEQLAEGDLVTTRKNITGTHTGIFMGIAPTGKTIKIDIIDIVKIKDGKYAEHWGVNTLFSVLNDLRNNK